MSRYDQVSFLFEKVEKDNEFVAKIVQNPAKSLIFGAKSSISIEQPVHSLYAFITSRQSNGWVDSGYLRFA